MNHETPSGKAKRGKAKSGPWKLLAIAGAAAVVLGGGYYVWQNTQIGSPQSAQLEPDYAANDYAPGDHYDDNINATTDARELPADSGALPATSAPRAAPAPQRQAASRSEAAEQVIGVTPVSLTPYDDDDIVVTANRRPQWARVPTERRLASVYPARALERGREGEAMVRCTVLERGALDCEQVSEVPANAGFGRAAVRVARMFRHGRERADGSSAIGTPVNMRVVFRMSEEDSRRAWRS